MEGKESVLQLPLVTTPKPGISLSRGWGGERYRVGLKRVRAKGIVGGATQRDDVVGRGR